METLAAANVDQGSILFAHVQQAQGRHRAETYLRQCRCFSSTNLRSLLRSCQLLRNTSMNSSEPSLVRKALRYAAANCRIILCWRRIIPGHQIRCNGSLVYSSPSRIQLIGAPSEDRRYCSQVNINIKTFHSTKCNSYKRMIAGRKFE